MTLPLVAGLLLAVAGDQVTKALVRGRLAEGAAVHLLPGLRLRRVTNRRGGTGARALAVVGALVLAAGALVPALAPPLAQAGLGLALGGAGANALERRRRGGVTDFVDLGWWPVFNVADAAIVAGTALALWRLV